MARKKVKKHRGYRPPSMDQMLKAQQAREQEALQQARERLAQRLETTFEALDDTFQSAYDEVESAVGDWMNEQGFDKGSGVNEKLADIALMHSELSEATEAIRKVGKGVVTSVADINAPPRPFNPDAFLVKEPHIEDPVAEELADCIIRIMHFGSQHGHNVSGAIISKCIANLRRGRMHGKLA